ncbi:unnamed protein product [Closterium sp. Yama58-4]|nr:unnamed protein product [Closterium sp. Yama58-4]
MGRISLNGGASTDDKSTTSIAESANGRSAVAHVHSPRRSLARTASLQEIRVAYRSLCRKWHPDVNKDAGAAAMFMDVNRAYEAAVQAHEKASKAKPQRPARRKDDFDEFWDDFLGGKPSTPKADPRRKRQGMKAGTGGGGERMRDPLACSSTPSNASPLSDAMLSEATSYSSNLLAACPINRRRIRTRSAVPATERINYSASPATHVSSPLRSLGLRSIRYSHIRRSGICSAQPATRGNQAKAARNAADTVSLITQREQLQEQKPDTEPVSALEWASVLTQDGSRRCLVGLLLFLAISAPPYVPLTVFPESRLATLAASTTSFTLRGAAPAAAAATEDSASTETPDLSAATPARRSPPRVVLPPPPYLRAADVAAERAAFESRVDRAVRALEDGRRAQAEGRWADALALYTEVQEQYPDLALSVYGKAGRALMEYQVGDMRTAVTRLRVLSVEFKGYPEVHAALAAALYVEGGAAAAERQFTIATLLDSRYSNLAWLESERHWPATLLLHMKRFLLLQ